MGIDRAPKTFVVDHMTTIAMLLSTMFSLHLYAKKLQVLLYSYVINIQDLQKNLCVILLQLWNFKK